MVSDPPGGPLKVALHLGVLGRLSGLLGRVSGHLGSLSKPPQNAPQGAFWPLARRAH